jgi:hypothetical protein
MADLPQRIHIHCLHQLGEDIFTVVGGLLEVDQALAAPTPARPARRIAPGVRMIRAAVPRKRIILTPAGGGGSFRLPRLVGYGLLGMRARIRHGGTGCRPWAAGPQGRPLRPRLPAATPRSPRMGSAIQVAWTAGG